jgi:ribonuclease HI
MRNKALPTISQHKIKKKEGSQMTHVNIWTDGACSGNPGPAGWVALLQCGRHEKQVVGGATRSTGNRAELMAVIAGLQALKVSCKVTIHTDSQYVIGTLDNGWKRKTNHDLLVQADALLAEHDVSFVKVKGHAGILMNERCDRAAKAEVERQRSKANLNGTVCVGCGCLSRSGTFCEDRNTRLSPEEKTKLWVEYCQQRRSSP